MPIILCENTNCEHLSKKRSKFIDGKGCEALRHTCKAKVVHIRATATGDESIVDYLGYQPYECSEGVSYD